MPSAPAAEPVTGFWSLVLHNLQLIFSRPEVLFGRLGMIVIAIVAALVVYGILWRMLARMRRRLEARLQAGPTARHRRLSRSLTVLSLLGSVAKWTILLAALLWILAIAGVNLLPILAGAGVAGLAVGLGAQSLIRDFLSGLFVMLEGQFAIGDHVNIGGTLGTVEEMGLRVTVLRDLQGQLHYIPNGSIGAVTVYEAPRVQWGVNLALPAEAVPAARAALVATLEDLRTEFPRKLLGWATPRALDLQGGYVGLQTIVAVFPEQKWLLDEELAPRWLRRLAGAGVALPEGVQPRVYVALRGETG
jgi:small conductance mechanosensitive channel